MNKNNDFLGTAPVGKLLFKLALPTIAAQLINMLYNIVDRIYIGHMPGDGDLALTEGGEVDQSYHIIRFKIPVFNQISHNTGQNPNKQ